MTPLQIITSLRVVPAVVIDDASQASMLGLAMKHGGLPCIEVTLRTPAALDAIRSLSKIEGMLVGAGTVTNAEQLQQSIDAGAKFIVTPGLDDDLIRRCQDKDLLIIPGAVTPTEIMRAQNLGLKLVKFFPSNIYGGLPAIEALSGPFPEMRFLPTGGINFTNLATFLGSAIVTACGGTWMAKRESIRTSNFPEIERSCRATMEIVQGTPQAAA
jgi:2-dehydro-3-deoxyphosphogluconate aldolase/(4S)-4-hydroxy-2-oxoglutarate aldolase